MELGEVVPRIAGRYAAKCWWADRDDLEQEAWVAVLEAKSTWDPDRGVPLHWYAWRAAALRLRNYLWEHSSPVTGPRCRGEVLKGLTRAPAELLDDMAAKDPDEVEAVERWWAGLSEHVREIVRCGRHGDLATRTLLGPETAVEVALDTGWSVSLVQKAAWRARKRIRDDIDLRHAVSLEAGA
jgi:DNA-directed RNA polymerase specialized sigma24 family protein